MMNLDRIRHLFDYHFALNRKFWHFCAENLSWEQMSEKMDISVGSIKNQFVHLMSVDARWFSGLRRTSDPGTANPDDFTSFEDLRVRWDIVEADMRMYLEGLSDNELEKPFDEDMKTWQVLSHVVNHGTAHRAQTGAMLRHFGLKPPPQDYILFVMGRI